MLQLKLIFFVLVVINMPANSLNTHIQLNKDQALRLEEMQSIFTKITKMYQDYAKEKHIPGYAFGIMMDGKLVYTGTGGYSNLKEKIPVSTQSMFRIASMTKSFTALAILKLRDEGKLKLDDPASLYIPELKDRGQLTDSSSITIRNLLTHTAGFPEDNPWGDRQLGMTHDEFIALIKKGFSFSNPVGSTFEYSNLGYALLGLIIEKVSGMSYQEYIAKNIWHPLKMEQAAWDYSKIPSKKLAQGYRWVNTEWTEEPMLVDGYFGSMGGMLTSIEAFSTYVGLFQNAWSSDSDIPFFNKSSLLEMQQAKQFNQFDPHHKLLNNKSCPWVEAYGYGLRWFHDCDKKTYIGHAGGLPGFGSNWLIVPEYNIGVILFANVTYAPAFDINVEVLQTLVTEGQLKPKDVAVSPTLNERQQALLKILPDWNNAEESGLFADNFFLDFSINERKKESQHLFKKAGKILNSDPIKAENQLRGTVLLNGEHSSLKIHLTLTPTKPALIQAFKIEEVEHSHKKS